MLDVHLDSSPKYFSVAELLQWAWIKEGACKEVRKHVHVLLSSVDEPYLK